jgi:hypothetical protein
LTYAVGASAFLLACIGAARLAADRNFAALILILGVLLSALYFLQTRTFFERNLSHALPVLFVLSGMGVREVASRMARGSTATSLVAATLLGIALALPSAQITGKLADVSARLGRLQETRSFEAKLSGEHFLLVDIDANFWRIDRFREWICGPVVFKLIDYGDRYMAAMLDSTVSSGRFELIKRLKGPFHGAPPSTLQTYHMADIVYLAVVEKPHQPCRLRFEPMQRPAAAEALVAPVQLRGAAVEGGLPDGTLDAQWIGPIYNTWAGSDQNVGEIYFGPFRACHDVVFPVIGGPRSEDNRLRVAERIGSDWRYIHDGVVPLFRQGASLVRLPVAPGECRSLWISAADQGTAWGQWVGIGEPVMIRDRP